MLPEDGFIVPLEQAAEVRAPFNRTKAREDSYLVAWERAGRALNDPSQGMDYQDWQCYYSDKDKKIYIEAEDTKERIAVADANYVRELSFAFNQNMQWNLVYKTKNGRIIFTWYNSVTESHFTEVFDLRMVTPKLTLDDSRPISSSTNDVLFTYIFNRNLCIRRQRDRFAQEIIVVPDLPVSASILRFGLTDTYRLQWILNRRVLI